MDGLGFQTANYGYDSEGSGYVTRDERFAYKQPILFTLPYTDTSKYNPFYNVNPYIGSQQYRTGRSLRNKSGAHGLGKNDDEKRQKIADVFDSISRAVRGDRGGASDFLPSQPIPIQNVALIIGVGYVVFKLVELVVKNR